MSSKIIKPLLTLAGVGTIVTCSLLDLPPKKPERENYGFVRFGENNLIDLNRDRRVDIITYGAEMLSDVLWVAPDMIEEAKRLHYNVTDSTPRMSPELRESSSRLLVAIPDYNYDWQKKIYDDYQAGKK